MQETKDPLPPQHQAEGGDLRGRGGWKHCAGQQANPLSAGLTFPAARTRQVWNSLELERQTTDDVGTKVLLGWRGRLDSPPAASQPLMLRKKEG